MILKTILFCPVSLVHLEAWARSQCSLINTHSGLSSPTTCHLLWAVLLTSWFKTLSQDFKRALKIPLLVPHLYFTFWKSSSWGPLFYPLVPQRICGVQLSLEIILFSNLSFGPLIHTFQHMIISVIFIAPQNIAPHQWSLVTGMIEKHNLCPKKIHFLCVHSTAYKYGLPFLAYDDRFESFPIFAFWLFQPQPF